MVSSRDPFKGDDSDLQLGDKKVTAWSVHMFFLVNDPNPHLHSKNFPTDPWSIPQTPNQQFMKEFLSFGGLGMSGVCSRGMLGFP